MDGKDDNLKIAPIPAPWNLKARFWAIFALSSLPGNASFPAGWAFPTEAEALAEGGEFIGGIGSVMVVSYDESPVASSGPYNELMYIPGQWKYPDGSKAFRITRIYVSSMASVENGRRNWGVPKHLAEFKFATASDGALDLSVSLPESTEPFFGATITRIPVLSSLKIPFTSKLTGKWLTLTQPPLPRGPSVHHSETDGWSTVMPAFKCKSYFGKGAGTLRNTDFGDGINFPKVAPWSLVVVLEGVDLTFGESTWKKDM